MRVHLVPAALIEVPAAAIVVDERRLVLLGHMMATQMRWELLVHLLVVRVVPAYHRRGRSVPNLVVVVVASAQVTAVRHLVGWCAVRTFIGCEVDLVVDVLVPATALNFASRSVARHI